MSKSAKQNEIRTIPLTNGYVTIIDAEDYEKVAPFKWFAKAKKAGSDEFYAARSQREGKSVRTIFMHRFIMDCPTGKEVDHGDTDKLNNRRSNLEVVTRQENMQRRWKR